MKQNNYGKMRMYYLPIENKNSPSSVKAIHRLKFLSYQTVLQCTLEFSFFIRPYALFSWPSQIKDILSIIHAALQQFSLKLLT